ncbi:MAG TPA: PilN domain-containing protein [Vicinamibacterales bacterium]|jgi:type IV pilus assembly protein PilN|nr:PilN domain-containing protein [Vicinamibacterales bacterium]
MIRINLLGTERKQAKKAPAIDLGQRLTVACSLILVASVAGIGWWYWTLQNESARVDNEIVMKTAEAARLQSLLTEVQKFEAQRTQLQQRVQLIEQLRSGQSVPVQLLDHVSKSLPDMLWLTDMNQDAGSVTIQGRSTTLIALSDFVANLGNGGFLKKPIDIVNSVVENNRSSTAPGAELINFTVKAELASAGRAAGAGPAGKAASPAGK